jgi:hypothetical protein
MMKSQLNLQMGNQWKVFYCLIFENSHVLSEILSNDSDDEEDSESGTGECEEDFGANTGQCEENSGACPDALPSPGDKYSPPNKQDIRLAKRALDCRSLVKLGLSFRCGCRRNCMGKFNMASAFDMIYDLWHDYPCESLRRDRLHALLKYAWKGNKFCFTVDDSEVCEPTYRACLGLGYQMTMWKNLKKLVSLGGDRMPRQPARKQDSRSTVFDAMRRWIMNFAEKSCDRMPVNDINDAILYVVPFMKVTEFAAEYFADVPDATGSTDTFKRAFRACRGIRTMRCKGNFSTCGICDHASKLLANTHGGKRLTNLEKEVCCDMY